MAIWDSHLWPLCPQRQAVQLGRKPPTARWLGHLTWFRQNLPATPPVSWISSQENKKQIDSLSASREEKSEVTLTSGHTSTLGEKGKERYRVSPDLIPQAQVPVYGPVLTLTSNFSLVSSLACVHRFNLNSYRPSSLLEPCQLFHRAKNSWRKKNQSPLKPSGNWGTSSKHYQFKACPYDQNKGHWILYFCQEMKLFVINSWCSLLRHSPLKPGCLTSCSVNHRLWIFFFMTEDRKWNFLTSRTSPVFGDSKEQSFSVSQRRPKSPIFTRRYKWLFLGKISSCILLVWLIGQSF